MICGPSCFHFDASTYMPTYVKCLCHHDIYGRWVLLLTVDPVQQVLWKPGDQVSQAFSIIWPTLAGADGDVVLQAQMGLVIWQV